MNEDMAVPSVDPAASPAEPVTPDYNDPNYDESDPASLHDADPVDNGTPEPSDEPSDEPEPQVAPEHQSPRYEKRIRQLSAKVKELRTSQDPANPPVAPVAPQTPQLPPQVAPRQLPPGDYTPEEIQAWVQAEAARTGQALSSIEVAQLRQELALRDEVQNVQSQYSQDLHTIETKYPELNEDSPQFDPHLSQVVTELYEESLLANPKTASLSKIAERIMGINRRTASKSAAQAARTVASQSNSASPTSSSQGPSKSAGNKWTEEAIANLSEEEYEANEADIKRDLYGW